MNEKVSYIDPVRPIKPRIKIEYKRGLKALIITTTIDSVMEALLSDPRFVVLERKKRPTAISVVLDAEIKGVLPLRKDSPKDIINMLLSSPLLEEKERQNGMGATS